MGSEELTISVGCWQLIILNGTRELHCLWGLILLCRFSNITRPKARDPYLRFRRRPDEQQSALSFWLRMRTTSTEAKVYIARRFGHCRITLGVPTVRCRLNCPRYDCGGCLLICLIKRSEYTLPVALVKYSSGIVPFSFCQKFCCLQKRMRQRIRARSHRCSGRMTKWTEILW